MKLIPTTINPVTITLYRGIPFDNNYNEHTLFSKKFRYTFPPIVTPPVVVGRAKEEMLNVKDNNQNYVYPRTTKSGTFNFSFGNGLVTSVVMELTDNEINSNYMKVVSGNDVYYYFITGLIQKNELTYLLNLELDVFMTFGDEFLDSINQKPVMVDRKHCRRILRTPSTTKINPVCFNQESTFNELKSNVVKEMNPLEFKDFVNGNNDFNDLMGELSWIYLIIGKNTANLTGTFQYRENGVNYPYSVNVVPSVTTRIKWTSGGTDKYVDVYNIDDYIGQPAVQKVIISPFPPFKECSNITITRGQYGGYEMNVNTILGETSDTVTFYTGANNTGSRFVVLLPTTINPHGKISIIEGYGGKFNYKSLENYFTTGLPSIYDEIDFGEYKLQIAPFKDLRMSSYYGGENQISTQYKFLEPIESDWNEIEFFTIASSNAEVNSYYDCSSLDGYDLSAKRGISNSVAYNFPTGTNAELLFNQTQKNQYENSKIINAVNSGLKITAGALTLGFSSVLKPLKPLGVVAGAVGMASGVVGEIQTFTDWSAKMKDLRNTPNTYNFSGSSLPYDKALANSDENNDGNLLPYLITYGVTEHEYNIASEFLYHYGYEYNAESYFNTSLNNNNDGIFNRTLFNYVKIREDITSKLVSDDLPLVVAKKISEILNAGIKFWTFFGTQDFNYSMLNIYFQKSLHCNAEIVSEDVE